MAFFKLQRIFEAGVGVPRVVPDKQESIEVSI